MIFESAGKSRYLRLTKILQILWSVDRVKYSHGREGAISLNRLETFIHVVQSGFKDGCRITVGLPEGRGC